MSVLGIGVDMVEVERIQHSLDRFGERFMKRVFTEGEIAYCHLDEISSAPFRGPVRGEGSGLESIRHWRRQSNGLARYRRA